MTSGEKRRKARLDAGYCYRCGINPATQNSRVTGSGQCETCVLKSASRRHLGKSNRWRELRVLLESQDNRCVYSNKYISPGSNAHLDHIIAKCNGGISDIENLQWIDGNVNNAKGTLSEQEFFDMIKEIHDHSLME